MTSFSITNKISHKSARIKPKMKFALRKEAEKAKYYGALNLLKTDFDGSKEEIKRVQVAHRQVMAYAHKDRGGNEKWAA